MAKNPINQDLRLSLVISGVLVFQILTFPTFFFLNPFSNSLSVFLTVAQIATMVGWILLLIAPPVLLALRETIGKNFTLYLSIVALVWPAALLLVRFAVLSLTGDPAINYLFNYPIFMFSDIVVPILYWRMARRQSAVKY
jgi:hypothetical protein